MNVETSGRPDIAEHGRSRTAPQSARSVWRIVRRWPPTLLIGATIVSVVIVVAAGAAALTPFPFDQMHYNDVQQPPNARYLFGTDEYGRDVLSRVIMGSRISLAYAFGCASISLFVGVPLGLWAGYKGGRIDEIMMRALDVFMAIPPLLLGLLVLAMTTPALWKTILAIGLVSAPSAARIVRSETLTLKNAEFVEAARAFGATDHYIVFRDLLMNIWPLIVVEAGLRTTFGILMGAALSFLGLGAQPPSSDWGLMISEARPLVTVAPWVALFPGLAMFTTVIGFNLLGDGLRDALDPRLQ